MNILIGVIQYSRQLSQCAVELCFNVHCKLWKATSRLSTHHNIPATLFSVTSAELCPSPPAAAPKRPRRISDLSWTVPISSSSRTKASQTHQWPQLNCAHLLQQPHQSVPDASVTSAELCPSPPAAAPKRPRRISDLSWTVPISSSRRIT